MRRRAWTTADLVPLYLIEHPEDEPYFGSQVMLDNGEGPHDVVTYDAAIRLSLWGVKHGYFTEANHKRLVALLAKAKARAEEDNYGAQ